MLDLKQGLPACRICQVRIGRHGVFAYDRLSVVTCEVQDKATVSRIVGMKGHTEQAPFPARAQFDSGHGQERLVPDLARFESENPDSTAVFFNYKKSITHPGGRRRKDWIRKARGHAGGRQIDGLDGQSRQ